LIVVASLAATGFVFRDDLKAALHSVTGPPEPINAPAVTPTPSEPSPTSSHMSLPTQIPTPVVSSLPTASPTPTPSATNTTVVTTDQLKDELPVVAPQPHIDLTAAVAGSPYRDEIPAFQDPGGKGLRVEADPAPPPGLSLVDHGDGSSEISGVPANAGSSTFEVVATNHKGRSARMTARIVVAAAPTPPPKPVKPPRATQRGVDLGSATVGADFLADLPPFDPGDDSRGVALRANPDPPEGLTFTDEGGGLGRLSGKPTRPGTYDFAIVGATPSGSSDRMAVRITVAQAPPLPPSEVSGAFLRAFDGGPCFLARAGAPGDAAGTIEAIGDDMTVFQRFQAEYRKLVGNAPTANYKAISPPQCPALEVVKATAPGGQHEPQVELARFEVGGGQPLAGTVSGLGRRRLVLLIVGEDGVIHHIPTTSTSAGDVASFSAQVGRVDDSSIGPLQLLIAIVSDKPLPSVDGFRTGTIRELAPKLAAEWRDAGAAARVELFQFKK